MTREGLCPSYVKDSTAAELAAVFAAIHLAITTWDDRVRGILVCSDCQAALAMADLASPLARSEANRKLQERIRTLAASRSLEIQPRWVKGHRAPSDGTSAFLNDWCDRSARRIRRAKARDH